MNPWIAVCQASLSFTISWSLLKLMSLESVMPSNHLILCHPLLLLTSIFPSIRVFSFRWLLASGGLSIRASTSVLPVNYSRLISFRIDCFHLLDAPRTLKSLLQHYSSKVSIIWLSAFFMVQLSHLYMSTGKAQRRQWHPTPVLLPGKSRRQKSLVGCSPWGR